MLAFYLGMFVLGAIFGSFAGALLHRFRTGESIMHGRSRCVSCNRVLRPIELVPVLGYLLIRGKCRGCRARVSWQYPLIELTCGLLFVLAARKAFILPHSGSILEAVWLCFAVFMLLLVFVYDARWKELPDVFMVVGTAGALIFGFFLQPQNILKLLLGAVIGAAFYAAQHFLGKGKWVGTGDILVGAMIGAMTGFPGVLQALFFSYVVGMVIILILMVAGKKRLSDAVALGPFLAIGTLVVLLTDLAGMFPKL